MVKFHSMRLAVPVWMNCVLVPGAKQFPAGTKGTAVRLTSGQYHINVADPDAETTEVYDAIVGLAAIYLGAIIATANEG